MTRLISPFIDWRPFACQAHGKWQAYRVDNFCICLQCCNSKWYPAETLRKLCFSLPDPKHVTGCAFPLTSMFVLLASSSCTTVFLSCMLQMQERKQYDEKLVKMDTKRLCELTSAADSLEMRPLVGAGSVNDVVFRR
eukprot:scaffold87540_cov18-Tisochrysis_lutea.AAC.4